MSYDRFAEAFGTKITQADTPFLLHLLNRVEQDVQTVAFFAKDFYSRHGLISVSRWTMSV
ncbi:MAG: hypothetical protein WDN23_05160 [Edaphobacter sp.]